MKKTKVVTLESLSLLIHQKVNELMNSPVMAHIKDNPDSSKIAETLVNTLNAVLHDEEEANIQHIADKIKKNKNSIEKREEKLLEMKKQFREEYRSITDETASLQKEFEKYNEIVSQNDNKNAKKDEKIKEKTRKKEIALEQLLNIIDESQTTQKELTAQMDELRKFIQYFQKGTKKMMKQATQMCAKKLEEAYAQCENNKQSVQSAIESSLQDQINFEKEEQERLKTIAESMLNSMQALNPENIDIGINADSFDEHPDGMIEYIKESLELQHKKTRQKILSDIHEVYPDLPMHNDDPQYAVEALVRKNMQEKEDEYNTLLKKRHDREIALKNQLKAALYQIQQLKASVSEISITQNSLFDDIDIDDNDGMNWESTRKELDDKISELSKYKSESESSMNSFRTSYN